MDWEIFLDRQADKSLSRFPKTDRGRISDAIETMKINPYAGDLQRMGGKKDIWRRRVGNYRVFFEVRLAEKIIYVFEIKRRGSNTYSK